MQKSAVKDTFATDSLEAPIRDIAGFLDHIREVPFRYDVCRLGAFRALNNLESHRFPLGQGSETLTLDGGEVHKNLLAVVLDDKTKPP